MEEYRRKAQEGRGDRGPCLIHHTWRCIVFRIFSDLDLSWNPTRIVILLDDSVIARISIQTFFPSANCDLTFAVIWSLFSSITGS